MEILFTVPPVYGAPTNNIKKPSDIYLFRTRGISKLILCLRIREHTFFFNTVNEQNNLAKYFFITFFLIF